MMPQNLSRQGGMTAIGWLIVLGLIAFFTLLTLRIAPIYLENYTVKSTLDSLRREPFITKKSPSEVTALLRKRFGINYVTNVSKDHISVVKKGGITKVDVTYEVRRPMVGNLDIIVSFSNQVELVAN